MALIYGILYASGKMLHKWDSGEPCWFATREELRDYWCPRGDKVIILNTETLNIVVEDKL